MESDILKFILGNQGSVDANELLWNWSDSAALTEALHHSEKLVSCSWSGAERVVAQSRLTLCRARGCEGCGRLHLCMGFLFSQTCHYKRCHFSHELESQHNTEVLRSFGLETLSRTELCLLLLQSDPSLLPPICHDYNNGGDCQDECPRLHICDAFLSRDCDCPRSHDFSAPQPLKLLRNKRIPNHLIKLLKPVYANKAALRRNANPQKHKSESAKGGSTGPRRGAAKARRGPGGKGNAARAQATTPGSDQRAAGNHDDAGAGGSQTPTQSDETASDVETGTAGGADGTAGRTFIKGKSSGQNAPRHRDKTEICLFFIKGHCKHEDRCFKAHDKMPYRWEIKQSGQWTVLADNEKIERDFCDPQNTYSSTSPAVNFDTMKCKTDEVRRLSTENSVLEPDFLHTTDWLWYWEDEYGAWYEYAAITSEHRLSSISSKELEERHLQNDQDVVTFTAGSQSYELSFRDMIQTNVRYGTKRLVRRRPRFVSAADVLHTRKRPPRSTAVPNHWDKALTPSVGFKTVALQPSSREYKEIQNLFLQTMAAFEILQISRIQNKAVWEAYQLCKTHLKIKNGGVPVLEKKLFHGTELKHVDTICEANFDWRVCGVNGTVYGQGSYFARDARYSHNYTGSSDPRFMFVSLVLVGDFCKGSSEYRRAPSKDGSDVNRFDSCVDDVSDPSIFVVFKEQQIYPEYLLQYTQTGRGTFHSPSRNMTSSRPPVSSAQSSPSPASTSTSTDAQSSCIIA